MVVKRWNIPEVDPEALGLLSKHTRCSDTVARLLLRRGLEAPDAATRFLEPKLLDLADPEDLPDIDRAVERIVSAISSCEQITVFGDYDVDGVTSTCLLLDFFRLVDYPVGYRLPHRLREGYGLRCATVRELAESGTQLIVTVDNGSSSTEEIRLAAELGVDVVVIDHHQPSSELPEPCALVNPWLGSREGDGETDSSFRDLAGVGVTFKVVWALAQHFSRAKKLSPHFRQFLLDSMALVALGTVADVVPLRDENRVLTKFGLLALEKTSRPGLRRLVELALRSKDSDERLEASHIGFRMGPRLNAAGRLGQAEKAIELLQTQDDSEAGELLDLLERENTRRRSIEAEILDEARRRVLEGGDIARDRCIVLGDASWHPGVIGIVAARLVEEFYRPAILFAFDGESGRGSARSIPQVHIHEAMRRCEEHLIQFGGHALAAGAEIRLDKIDAFREALQHAIDMDPLEMVPEVDVDCHVSLENLNGELLHELSRLSPHGEGNPTPLFAALDVEIVGKPRLMGKDGQHLSFHVRQRGGNAAFRAIAFGMGERIPQIERRGTRVSLLFEPQWNVWQGRRSIELLVRDLRVGDGQGSAPGAPRNAAER